jgi:hypothetical protein
MVLTVPALDWLLKKKTRVRLALAAAAVVLMLTQGIYFQWVHHTRAGSPQRLFLFDADYFATILPMAVNSSGARSVYVAHTSPIPGYIQVLWYTTQEHLPTEKFVMLEPNEAAADGATVITTESTCPRCQILFQRDPYTIYIAHGPPRKLSPLQFEALRAEIRPVEYPAQLYVGQQATLRVVARNVSNLPWLARERAGDQFQINLGNHWLDPSGKVVTNDDGRAPLLRDLSPGDEAEFRMTINAPKTPGNYLLEIDMLQEGVSWFAERGSKTVRLPVTVYRRWFD